ncbi:carbohydrate kinase family protein [Tuberibacillus sp. Marseille-P3662]|uniref:carbohydrate kinase family protein n=1 Tax=Tuberibacillus sp. Marseille-P3662 TaxID=1965358 RepID=UPI000A1CB2A2|nr:carbohydrate kinase family protein [Tuberibacillus sp. Marseille-P3662]
MEKYDVLVSGTISVDVIFSSIPKMPSSGEEVYCGRFEFTCGAAFNTAVALARLGLNVAMAAPIGNDFLSEFIMNHLKAEGISTEHMKHFDQPLQTLSVALNYEGDRSFISYEDQIQDFNPEDYINTLVETVDARVLHICAKEETKSTIRTAKQRGMTVVLDVGWDESWLKDPELKEIIKMGDLFTPNLKEALVITGETDAEKALEALNKLNSNNVIIKLGEDGALFKKEGVVTKVPSSKRDVVDTTGAGDVFSAGLLTGLLKDFELEEAVRLGNFCGGCSVEGMGGTKTSPNWSRVCKEFFEI